MGSGISSHFGKKSKNRQQAPPTAVVNGPATLAASANDRPYVIPLDLHPVISTPRNIQFISDLEGKKICVPYTPVGSEALVFKYYCPLCMRFFKDIMKSDCCGNYVCIECFNDYLESKGIDKCFTKDTEMIIQSGILEDVTCPHCVHFGFQISFVSDGDEVRDYSRNVPILKLESSNNGSSKNNLPLPSPLRVGESFEDLKRKMIPFKLQNKLQPVASESRIEDGAPHVSPRLEESLSTHGSPQPEDENIHPHLPDPVSLFQENSAAVSAKDSDPSLVAEEGSMDVGVDVRLERSPLRTVSTSPEVNSPIFGGSGDIESDELSVATPLPARRRSGSEGDPSQYELSTFSLNLEQSISEIRAVVIPQVTQHVEVIREEQ